jgi:hypothetical protein
VTGLGASANRTQFEYELKSGLYGRRKDRLDCPPSALRILEFGRIIGLIARVYRSVIFEAFVSLAGNRKAMHMFHCTGNQ